MPNPVGRPTKYYPGLCQALIDHMKQGGSFDAFCAVPECNPVQLYRWLDKYPEFRKAKEEGEALSKKFWEDAGRAGSLGQLRTYTRRYKYQDVMGPDGLPERGPDGKRTFRRERVIVEETEHPAAFNARSWQLMMQNRFGWAEKKEIEHSGKDGGPILTKSLTDDELSRRTEEVTRRLLDAKKTS